MTPHDEQNLERLIHQTLHPLPPRRAPRTLEARVLAELERRAARPWWHQSYAHWPVAVRTAFFLGTAAIAALLVVGLFSMMRLAGTAPLAARFDTLALVRDLGRTAIEAGGALWRAIPPLWLYGALAAVATCYATLVGVGAAAYRTYRTAR